MWPIKQMLRRQDRRALARHPPRILPRQDLLFTHTIPPREIVETNRAYQDGTQESEATLRVVRARYHKELSRAELDIQRLESGRKGQDAEQGVRADGAICRPSDSIFQR